MSSTSKSTVFVADDDADVLGSLRFLLETDGFDVRTFRNGAALLSAVRSTGVDCFVIDYKMPNMNGIEMLKALKTDQPELRVPIIMLTTEAQPGLLQQAKQSGAKGWIVKPFKPEMLLAAVRKIVGDH